MADRGNGGGEVKKEGVNDCCLLLCASDMAAQGERMA